MASNIQVLQPQPINQREFIPREIIDDTVRQIMSKFNPQKIILFGSYGRNNPGPESDVDLLVVMDTPLKVRNRRFIFAGRLSITMGWI